MEGGVQYSWEKEGFRERWVKIVITPFTCDSPSGNLASSCVMGVCLARGVGVQASCVCMGQGYLVPAVLPLTDLDLCSGQSPPLREENIWCCYL